MTKEEMIECLEQFYEAAGFADVNVKELQNMSEDELKRLYEETMEG